MHVGGALLISHKTSSFLICYCLMHANVINGNQQNGTCAHLYRLHLIWSLFVFDQDACDDSCGQRTTIGGGEHTSLGSGWDLCMRTRADEVGVPIQSVSGLLREPSIQLLTLVVEYRALRFSLSFVGEAVLIACSKVSSRGTFSLQLLGFRGSDWLASWLQCAGPVSVLKHFIRLRVQTRFFFDCLTQAGTVSFKDNTYNTAAMTSASRFAYLLWKTAACINVATSRNPFSHSHLPFSHLSSAYSFSSNT